MAVASLLTILGASHPAQARPLVLREPNAVDLLGGFGSYTVTHVRRSDNARADAMANEAMDERATVGNPACEPGGGSAQGTLF